MRAGERAILVTCALYLIVVGHGLLAQLIPPAWAVWSAVALIVTVAATAAVFLRIAARREPRLGRHSGWPDVAAAVAEGLAQNSGPAADAARRLVADAAFDARFDAQYRPLHTTGAPGMTEVDARQFERCTRACSEMHTFDPGCQLYGRDPDSTGPIATVQAVDLDLDAARHEPRHGGPR